MAGLRIAIVGAGLMGRWHAYYAARAGAEIGAIVDRDPAAAQALHRRHPAAAIFSGLGECLERAAFDAVHICTGTPSHGDLALAALQAGKHVLVEKPAAGSVAETEGLVDAARRNGLLLCPVHQLPFQKGFRTLRGRWDRLGELVSVGYHACTAGGEGRPGGARRAVLLEILPHPLSLFLALGLAGPAGAEDPYLRLSDDDLEIHYSIPRGPGVTASISLRGRPTRNELTVVGTRGSAHLDLFHGFCFFEMGKVSRPSKAGRPFRYGASLLAAAGANLVGRALHAEPAYPGLCRLIHGFYDSIRSGASSPIRGEEMLQIAHVMDWAGGRKSVPINGEEQRSSTYLPEP